MKVSLTRRLEFDAAHRVLGHESKCANIHGHRYRVDIRARAAELDSLGRVIDFSVIKTLVGGWLDLQWDHTTILMKGDPAIDLFKSIQVNKPVFVCDWNPTAENMAHYLLRSVCPALLAADGIEVTRVRVYETPNCHAEAWL